LYNSCGVNNSDAQILAKMTSLEFLYFHASGGALRDVGTAHLSALTKLQDLRIFMGSFGDEGAVKCLSQMTGLKLLHIPATYITAVTTKTIATHLLNLKDLQLRFCTLEDNAIFPLAHLPNLESLEITEVSSINRTPLTDQFLLYLATHSHLKGLHLYDVKNVTDEGVTFFVTRLGNGKTLTMCQRSNFTLYGTRTEKTNPLAFEQPD
jgi:hypothetical protein